MNPLSGLEIEEVEREGSDCSSVERWEDEEETKEAFEREEGRCYDDPLWFGKTVEEIRAATENAKAEGNEASKEADWKSATCSWKNALKGAEKLKDTDMELRLRLNLALGYTRRGKPEKALAHCQELFRERLKCVATSELRAKAHYRCGEAHEAAGEESKAARSFRAALEAHPGNAEARRKLAELKHSEAERLQRERALFGRNEAPRERQATLDMASVQTEDRGSPPEVDEEQRAEARRLAARLAGNRRPLSGTLSGSWEDAGDADDEEDAADMPGLNMQVGEKVEIFGPARP